MWSREPYRFTTNDRRKPATSFVMLNDIHGRTADIPRLLDAAKFRETDFVIFNGDMVSHSSTEEQLFNSFMNKAVELFASEKTCITHVAIMRHAAPLLPFFKITFP